MDIGRRVRLGNLADDTVVRLAGSIERLTRLFLARSEFDLSRTEVNVLFDADTFPRRITELAAREGVTQPAMSLLVNRLEEQRWVERGPDPTDGRAVLVAITSAGEELIAKVRAEYKTLLHKELAELGDADVQRLERAAEIFEGLLDSLTDRDASGLRSGDGVRA
ncbi:MAG: MarR family transcriptional regulator [Acidimicrobiales bacterium]|jgi:DNA-binding MarR family transcriptional regulator